MSPRIVHLHGLESAVDPHTSAPVGAKVQYLRSRFGDVVAPALRTEEAQAIIAMAQQGLALPDDASHRMFRRPLAAALAALEGGADVLVGSSFGGAVALLLVHQHGWRGPTVLLAGAGPKLTPYDTLPPQLPCVLVHGTYDEVIDVADSRALARNSPSAVLLEGPWDHRLHPILEGDLLQRAVETALWLGSVQDQTAPEDQVVG